MPQLSTPRRRLRVDLSILALVGVLLVAAVGAGGSALYRSFYSPSAFVMDYLELLSAGRAADALQLPGVAVERADLAEAEIEPGVSEALLRQRALSQLTEMEVVSEADAGQERTAVTVSYRAGGHPGTSTFLIEQDGWIGIAPGWRFAESPLAAIELTVLGADQFAVNGFAIDRRQVSVDGLEAAPEDPLPLLVFTPGVYAVTVDTPIAAASGTALLADSPMVTTALKVQAEPTEEFIAIVQERVEEFLEGCTEQEVLQPTACPFGFPVQNRINSAPKWSIAAQPHVAVEPDGAHWRIPPADAVAYIEVEIRSLFDGSVQLVEEEVPFQVNGTIRILADGSASIRVGSPAD